MHNHHCLLWLATTEHHLEVNVQSAVSHVLSVVKNVFICDQVVSFKQWSQICAFSV